MSSNTTFGPVYVATKRLSSSGNSYTVVLRQNTATTLAPLDNNRFALAHTANHITEPRVVHSKRTNTQTIPLEDVANYPEGKEVGGHIQRITHAYPQWDKHTPAYEGGYPSTQWHPHYVPDVDLRPAAN